MGSSMKKDRKRGANRNELAHKHRKGVHGNKQSKDIHEDRGTRQSKMGGFRR